MSIGSAGRPVPGWTAMRCRWSASTSRSSFGRSRRSSGPRSRSRSSRASSPTGRSARSPSSSARPSVAAAPRRARVARLLRTGRDMRPPIGRSIRHPSARGRSPRVRGMDPPVVRHRPAGPANRSGPTPRPGDRTAGRVASRRRARMDRRGRAEAARVIPARRPSPVATVRSPPCPASDSRERPRRATTGPAGGTRTIDIAEPGIVAAAARPGRASRPRRLSGGGSAPSAR